MKKKLRLILVICLITLTGKVYALEFDGNYFINNNGIKMTYNQVENLQNLGFNDKEIMYMDQNEFDANKNLIGNVVDETVKYYKTITYYSENSNLLSAKKIEPISVLVVKNKTEQLIQNKTYKVNL